MSIFFRDHVPKKQKHRSGISLPVFTLSLNLELHHLLSRLLSLDAGALRGANHCFFFFYQFIEDFGMVKNMYKLTIFIILLFLINFGSCSGAPPAEEDRIREMIKEVAGKAEAKDIGAIKKHISRKYRDPRGNDYQGLSGLLLYHFFRAEKISTYLTEMEVSVEGEKATAAVEAILTRGKEIKSLKDLIPEGASYYLFNLVFQKEQGEWLLISAEWKPVSSAQERGR
jgi:hypothetical protein